MLKVKLFFAFIQYSVILIYYRNSTSKRIIDQDLERWSNELNLHYKSNILRLVFLLKFRPQFRNLFYFRIPKILNCIKRLCPEDKSISIASDDNQLEGGALYFEHAFGTYVASLSIGYGCTIRQLCTIGVKSKNRHNEKPIIGSNVDFGANSTCIGKITIGDNAIIAAGAVVVKDVPENAIVAGNPAKIIRFRDLNYIN